MYGETTPLFAPPLTFARVHSGPDVYATSGHRLRGLEGDHSIAGTSENQGGCLHGGQDVSNVDLRHRAEDHCGHGRARAHPFIPAHQIADPRYVGCVAEDRRRYDPLTPVRI